MSTRTVVAVYAFFAIIGLFTGFVWGYRMAALDRETWNHGCTLQFGHKPLVVCPQVEP